MKNWETQNYTELSIEKQLNFLRESCDDDDQLNLDNELNIDQFLATIEEILCCDSNEKPIVRQTKNWKKEKSSSKEPESAKQSEPEPEYNAEETEVEESKQAQESESENPLPPPVSKEAESDC